MTQLRPAIMSLLLLTVLTGLVYPFVVTGIAQVLFPTAANGSLMIGKNGQPVGSSLIGQSFSEAQYFWGRLSATGSFPYNAAASSGSNYGPRHPALLEAIRTRIAALQAIDPNNTAPLPVDLVTASGSGLDPHISPAAAAYQIGRIARTRGVPEKTIRQLVSQYTEGRTLGFLGEPRVHVLQLNMALDTL